MPRRNSKIPLTVMNPSIEEDLDSPSLLRQNRGLQRLYQNITSYLGREPSLREIETFLKEHKPSFPRKSRESIRQSIALWKATEELAIREAVEEFERQLQDNPYLTQLEIAELIQKTLERAIRKAIAYKLRSSKKLYPIPDGKGCQVDYLEVDENETVCV